MSKKTTKKNSAWFVPLRGSYIPIRKEGWLTYIPFIAYCIGIAVIAVQQSDALWYQLFTIATQWILAAMILTFVADKHN